jgi:hypothetical protein
MRFFFALSHPTFFNNLIFRFFTTNLINKRFKVQLGVLSTVDRGLSTIIRSLRLAI